MGRPVNGPQIDLTAIIVNYNTRELLLACLTALRTSASGLALQVVIVDNASQDGSKEALGTAAYEGCDIIFNATNVGFGRANNQALALARGRYVLLLNTDAFVEADTLRKTIGYLDDHPRCGLLGVRLVGRDGVLQPCCRYFPTPWNEFLVAVGWERFFPGTRRVDDMSWDHASPRECDWVPGCYYLVRRQVIDEVGLFDPRFFLYYEEVDHCRAVKAAGWTVVFDPETTVVHIGGESARTVGAISESGRQISALQIESALLYYRKHHGRWGLAAGLFLGALADAILAAKWLLRRRTWRGTGAFGAHAKLTWSLLLRTRWARQPTR